VPSRGYQVTAFGAALDHQIIYGETKIAGARVFDASTGANNVFLHRVIAFAGHEVEAFTEVWLNDFKLTVNLTTGAVTSAENSEETTSRFNSNVRVIARNGTDDQIAIPEMVNEIPEWTSSHRLRGIAYLYIRLQFDADVFPNGIPEITATIKGRKVYDPRTASVAWSDNAALCIRDYLTARFGLGALASEMDDVLIAQAANVCDQVVEGEARFTCNGAFTTDAQPADIVERLLTSMGGLLWHAQGKWRMKPAYYTSPILTLDEGDLRDGLRIQTRPPRRDNFNTVRGTWRGAASNWQVTDYVSVSDPAFVEADGGVDQSVDLDLPFTSSHTTAQRIARLALRQQREQLAISGSFGMRAFAVQVGDLVRLNNSRMGWVDKEFEVTSWTFTITDDLALEARMSLRETSQDVFTDVPGSVFETNNSSLPSPFFVPGVGITATVTQQILGEKITNFILVDIGL
jgi:predicted phage tail protein